jgi:hypothetical protein
MSPNIKMIMDLPAKLKGRPSMTRDGSKKKHDPRWLLNMTFVTIYTAAYTEDRTKLTLDRL